MERHERSAFSSPIAGKAVRATFDGGGLTSDAGVLLLMEIERRLGIAGPCQPPGRRRLACGL